MPALDKKLSWIERAFKDVKCPVCNDQGVLRVVIEKDKPPLGCPLCGLVRLVRVVPATKPLKKRGAFSKGKGDDPCCRPSKRRAKNNSK